jgi:hypothetical protein
MSTSKHISLKLLAQIFTLKKALVATGVLPVALLVAVAMHESAPAQNVQDNFRIEFQQGVITVKIENIPLERVLAEIQTKTGIKINILDRSLLGNKVTLSIQNAEPEHFLKTLLGQNYVFSFEKRPTDRVSKSANFP